MTVKQSVIQARNSGWTYSQITEEFGVAKSTAQGWVDKFNEGIDDTPIQESLNLGTPYVNDNLQRVKPSKFQKNEGEVLDFLEQLAPIQVNSCFDVKSKTTTAFAVVGSDFHFGSHDERAINVFLKTVEELQPQTVILNGDTMDCMAISKYPKDLKVRWSLLDERKAYHEFLDTLLSISNATIYETFSNHSGQSIDGRWRRYLSDRLGELACLPEITDTLSYQNVFMGDYQDYIQHVDYVDLNGLIVTHGTTVRKNGGYSCLGEIEKWKTSILHGHTHRIGSSCQRIPAIGGRPENQIYGFEGGCLCSLESVYGTAMNWNQGFNIVGLDEHSFSMEQVMINNGKANIATLGMTITA